MKDKPSEIIAKELRFLKSELEDGVPEYLLEERIQQVQADLDEGVVESIHFLYQYEPNAFRAFQGSPNRQALERALVGLSRGEKSWHEVEAIWLLYIEEAEAIESTLIHSEHEYNYKGFLVKSIQTPPWVLRIFESAIDFLVDLFQTKSVDIDLHELVQVFVFRPVHKQDKPSTSPGGLYTSDKKEVSLFWGNRSGLAPDKSAIIKKQAYNLIHYVIVHELSHGVYFHALSREAREFWVSDWLKNQIDIDDEGVRTDPKVVRERLRHLGIPTDYGHTNPSEDFAETLTHYILDNQSLEPYALERLVGTLTHPSNPKKIFKVARAEMTKTAALYNEILKSLDPKVISSAESLKAVAGGYVDKLEGEPSIFRVSDYEVRVSALAGDIKVSCSCDYWRYQGPEYHAHKNSYLLGKARGTLEPPTKRDPNSTHKLCKHAYAVLRDFFGE